MKVTDKEKEDILFALISKGDNYNRIGKDLNLSPRLVEYVDITENKKYGYTPEGRGKPSLQSYIVAIRKVSDVNGWNHKDPKIIEARKLYDQGLIEMCTGRDGFNLILYAIPRRMKAVRKPYFNKVVEAA